MTAPNTSCATRGFTLIEVLVALALIGIAVMAMLKATQEGILTQGAVRDRVFAEIVAENRLIEVMVMPLPPDLGASSGRVALADQDWLWFQTIAATSDPSIVRVDVSVKNAENASELAGLTAFRGRE